MDILCFLKGNTSYMEHSKQPSFKLCECGTLLTNRCQPTCYHLLLSSWSLRCTSPRVIDAPLFAQVWFNNATLRISSQYLRIHAFLSKPSQWLIPGNIHHPALPSFLINAWMARTNLIQHTLAHKNLPRACLLPLSSLLSSVLFFFFFIWRLSLPYCH